MLSLDIWSHVRSTHVHHTWQSAVTLWCAWISLCSHPLYCSEECALKNCSSWLHPRFSHYVSAELGFTTIFSGRLYWHPHSHGQRWFQDNKSLPRWFGFWKEMERERAHTVGEPLVDLIIRRQSPSWMIMLSQVGLPFLSYVRNHFLYTRREKG